MAVGQLLCFGSLGFIYLIFSVNSISPFDDALRTDTDACRCTHRPTSAVNAGLSMGSVKFA